MVPNMNARSQKNKRGARKATLSTFDLRLQGRIGNLTPLPSPLHRHALCQIYPPLLKNPKKMLHKDGQTDGQVGPITVSAF